MASIGNYHSSLLPSVLVVGGTDTSSRHWSPASPFPVPHSREPRPGSLEVPGMGLRPCGPQSADEISEMADRRDWGGGRDDPEESTQRIIERIWESLTDIWMRMDQQAPVPPIVAPLGVGGAIPLAPVPPLPGAEVPFVAPLPPPLYLGVCPRLLYFLSVYGNLAM
ncbi:hypothetical protein Taro_026927 [Colocasia esculenta]|uniref:Uncharacterized protein n=1 Tax=Colocasia esculenta TaxID=4460 RepID=A0A843VQ38_COLES|nr:hypothetical protein [Colocasia esculenta]